MANIVTEGEKFLGVSASVDTKERRSKYHNDRSEHWTIEDIVATAKEDGDLDVTGDMTVTGDLTVTGDGSAADLTVTGAATVGSLAVSALGTVPTSATDTGTLGEIRILADHIYVCTSTDVWVRAALTTWS